MNTDFPEIPTLTHPTINLPQEFSSLTEAAKNLSFLTQSGASILRTEVKKIPLLRVENLSNEGEIRLAILYYHMIQSAYIHIEEGESVIPKNIAIPSVFLSKKLNRGSYSKPPMLGYLSYVLDNWRLKDKNAQFSLENIEPLVTFTGTESEKAFILTHLMPFEYIGEGGIKDVVLLHAFIKQHENIKAGISLRMLSFFLTEMQCGFAQIEKYVSPDVYRNSIRRYLMSFNGVVYAGVEEYSEIPQFFTGASGAQTVTIPAFSLALGIRSKNQKITEALTATEKYLHPRHQIFLHFIRERQNSWEYIKRNKSGFPQLVKAYNECLKSLEDFRVSHAKFIASYIAPSGADPRGTGNTIIPWWLNAIIEETREYYL
jgi:indoleamine 2,3-dioxygenase